MSSSTNDQHVKKVPLHLQSSQSRVLIKDGEVVNADGRQKADVYVEDRIIKQVGQNLDVPGGARTIDATGKLVMPGGIDCNTHLDDGSCEDFYVGTKAGLAGGTTMIMDVVVPRKGESLPSAFSRRHDAADAKACCDFSLHVAVTHWNDRVRNEMAEMAGGSGGVNSFQMFLGVKDDTVLRDDEILEFLKRCKELGALGQICAENGHVIRENTSRLLAKGISGPEGHLLARPEEAEAEATARACLLAEQVGCPLYLMQVMSKAAARVIENKRAEDGNVVVFSEAIAAGLACDGAQYFDKNWRCAAGFVTSPPLRPDPTTPNHLLALLAQGQLDLAGTANRTFNGRQKAQGLHDFSQIPHGLNGLENRMSVLWERGVQSGKMSPERFVEATSTNAAKIFNIFPQKGAIAPGSDADLVIWDPDHSRTISAQTHHQGVDFNVFEGMVVRGAPDYVLAQGRVVVDEGQLKVVQGMGRFIPNPPYAPYVYEKVRAADERRMRSEMGVSRGEADMKIEDPIVRPMSTPTSPVASPERDLAPAVEEVTLDASAAAAAAATEKTPEPEQPKKMQPENPTNRPAIDSKPQIRVRNPPGGKSSIFF